MERYDRANGSCKTENHGTLLRVDKSRPFVRCELNCYNYREQRYPCFSTCYTNVNHLRWNDVSRTSEIATFAQFQVYLKVTQAKQMVSLYYLIISVQ